MFLRIFIIIIIQITIGYFVSPKIIAGPPEQSRAGEIDAKTLFKKHCKICHGEDGKGKTDLGEGLGARDFTNKEFQDSTTDEEIIEQITNGTPEKMFPFKDKLTPEEIKSLVTVVRAFRGK
ncbi:MAG: putative cytochrome [Candidatus Scalindua rubra]|uniref:Putative cytochrome n=1 Tax=Candidatus Scalindua rubra TaxID=1872076 RepID=A0A1E3X691_9BACT|nr:MAG: putative cytochrome [Candidatus Scalindua rubra]